MLTTKISTRGDPRVRWRSCGVKLQKSDLYIYSSSVITLRKHEIFSRTSLESRYIPRRTPSTVSFIGITLPDASSATKKTLAAVVEIKVCAEADWIVLNRSGLFSTIVQLSRTNETNLSFW